MTESELQERFKKFSIEVYHFTKFFPNKPVYSKVEDQLTKASSSAPIIDHPPVISPLSKLYAPSPDDF